MMNETTQTIQGLDPDRLRQIKLIAIDLDGTALTKSKKLTQRTRSAICNAIQAGLLIVPVTGRPLSGIPETVLSIPGLSYIITSNGAVTRDLQSGEVIRDACISGETAKEIVQIPMEHRLLHSVFMDGTGYCEDRYYRRLIRQFRNTPVEEYIRKSRCGVDNLPDYIDRSGHTIENIWIMTNSQADRDEIDMYIRARWQLRTVLTGKKDIEIGAAAADKGMALKDLYSSLGIPANAVLSIGDNENDLGMFHASGISVAMENATESIKKASSVITASNEADGVALILEELLHAIDEGKEDNGTTDHIDSDTVMQYSMEIAEGFGNRNIGAYAASTAFFFFLSLIPILVLSSSLIPYLGGMHEEDLVKAMTSITPDILDHLIATIIWESYNKSLQLVPLSILILIWASSQGILALIQGLNRIYRTNDQRNYFKLLPISILYTMIMFVVLFVIVLLVFSRAINSAIQTVVPDSPYVVPLMTTGRYLLAAGIGIVIFMLLYTFLPAGRRNFMYQLPGAILTVIVWVIFSLIFRIYVNGANRYTLFYGSLSTVAILLFWLYCCFYILLVGGFINNYFEEHIHNAFRKRREAKRK